MHVSVRFDTVPPYLLLRPENLAEATRLRCTRGLGRLPGQPDVFATPHLDLATQLLSDAGVQGQERLVAWASIAHRIMIASAGTTPHDRVDPCPGRRPGLYPFQELGVQRMSAHVATLLADEMGLGKTVQVAAFIDFLTSRLKQVQVLIICPAAVKSSWRREIYRWAPGLSPAHVVVLQGKQPPESWPGSDGNALVICNYDIVEAHTERLHDRRWSLVVLDECHYVKNLAARRTRLTVGRTQALDGYFKIALSGTPITNRPVELFPVLHWLDPVGWPNFMDYAQQFCNAHRDRWNRLDTSGAINLDLLATRLRRTVMLRRTKEQVLPDLPPKTRQYLELEATEEAARYLAAETQVLVGLDIADYNAFTPDEIVARINAAVLHQGGGELARLRRLLGYSKLEAIRRHLTDLLEDPARKIVFFAHHIGLLEQLAAAFDGTSVCYIGATTPAAREAAVEAFQLPTGPRLFLGQIQAAGVGITLTAADVVVFGEASWVPGEMIQAEDRCHRIGQTRGLLIQYLVYADSLDDYMIRVAAHKYEVIQQTLDNAKEN